MGHVTKHMLDEEKIANVKRKESVMCSCGHRTSVIHLNKRGWTTCYWCGKKIERPRDVFKNKLMGLMKGDK